MSQISFIAQFLRPILLLSLMVFNSSCTVITTDHGYYISSGNSVPCKKTPLSKYSVNTPGCTLVIPEIGYFSVLLTYSSKGAYNPDQTDISIKLTPMDQIQLSWSDPNMTIIDLKTSTARKVTILDTMPITGKLDKSYDPKISENWILSGSSMNSSFQDKPSTQRVELRFPPIYSFGKLVNVPPIQYKFWQNHALVPIYSEGLSGKK